MPDFQIRKGRGDRTLSEEELEALKESYPDIIRRIRWTPSPGFLERMEAIAERDEATGETLWTRSEVNLPEFLRRIALDEEA